VAPASEDRGESSLGVLVVLDQKDRAHEQKAEGDRPLYLLFGSRSFVGWVFP
jgi:hypothetical protein